MHAPHWSRGMFKLSNYGQFQAKGTTRCSQTLGVTPTSLSNYQEPHPKETGTVGGMSPDCVFECKLGIIGMFWGPCEPCTKSLDGMEGAIGGPFVLDFRISNVKCMVAFAVYGNAHAMHSWWQVGMRASPRFLMEVARFNRGCNGFGPRVQPMDIYIYR